MIDEKQSENETEKQKGILYAHCINKLYPVTMKLIENQKELDLFNNIEMPTAMVLAKMQYNGITFVGKNLI